MKFAAIAPTELSDQTRSFKEIELSLRNRSVTAIGLLAALGLSACGSGGGVATPVDPSNPDAVDTQTSPVVDGGSDGSTDTGAGGGISGGGGGAAGGAGGGGAGGGGIAPAANNLNLSRTGSDYTTSTVSGFALLGTDSHYLVADAASDAYTVTLTASGSGMLTFEFTDSDDTVSLEAGSSISGFSQLKVIRGTVDVSNADVGGITYVSVASSVKLTTEQVLNLDAIVINAASGNVEVLVQSQTEIDQITSALANGSVNLYSPADNLMTLAAAPNATVSAGQIASGQTTLNTEKQAISALNEAAIIVINGSTNGLVGSERSGDVRVNVFPDPGLDVISARLDGVSVGTITNNVFSLNGPNLTSGFHTLSVVTENGSGVQSVTQEEFLVVGSSNSAAEMFEFRTSTTGNLVTVDFYVKNLHSEISDGIRSFDFWIDIDQTKFDYIEGSFTPAAGSINAGAENQANGEVLANGFFAAPWKSYDDPLFTMEVNSLGSNQSLQLSFVDFTIYRTDFGDFSATVDI